MNRVTDQLCAELGFVDTGDVPGSRSALSARKTMAGLLSPEEEALARSVREALARIGAALGAGAEDPRARLVLIALDGGEMAVRGELVGGNAERLPQLLPSLVFLIALAVVERDRAIELSRRASELIAESES